MNHQLTAFIDDLRSTHRGNLVSVILYGSSAAGDRDVDSDYNMLVVLEKIGPADLRNAHAAIRAVISLDVGWPSVSCTRRTWCRFVVTAPVEGPAE